MKKKRVRKLIITGAVVLAAVFAVFIVLNYLNGLNAAYPVRTTALARQTLVNSISTKGIVESVSKRNVNSTLGANVRDIYVEVGDRVTEGQLLCQLDTEDLELNIAQSRADLNTSELNSLNQIENNQRLYDEAEANMRNGRNSQLLNAENGVRTAQLNLENAQRTYDDAVRDRDEGKTQGVVNASNNLTDAKADLESKQRDLTNTQALFNEGVVSRDQLTQQETAFTNAQTRYDNAVEALNAAKINEARAIEQAEVSLRTARTNYDNALAALSAARTAAEQELERYMNNITSAQITANMDAKLIAIQKLEKQLADSSITAPIAGTVTAVYAKEGQPGSGLLFVIEDTENLRVKTRIKEYDAGRVAVGMAVLIRSDATGNDQYDGTVIKLNPTAEKNAQGDTNTSGDIEFGADISVDTLGTPLKVGMNTRLTIILQSKEAVFCVPYDAVAERGEQRVIYVLEEGERTSVAREITVTCGMETDFYIEIESPELRDDMQIINDSANMSDGMAVRPPGQTDDMQLFNRWAGR